MHFCSMVVVKTVSGVCIYGAERNIAHVSPTWPNPGDCPTVRPLVARSRPTKVWGGRGTIL
jgi:hypothetical protein